MNNLQLFSFENKEVRFTGNWENPEWIAQDICDILGITNVSQALSDFDSQEKGISNTYTLGGEQLISSKFYYLFKIAK